MEEFKKVMKKSMGEVEDEDLHTIFMKVAANCQGGPITTNHVRKAKSRNITTV